jgi:cyanophycinase-like exopeptidase
MSGSIGLHGGGEFLAGDEAFVDAILSTAAGKVLPAGRRIRVVVVPTAAARQRPELAARHGVAAFERAGSRLGVPVDADTALVVDRRSAEDPALAERLGGADLVYLPGGDPDLIPVVLAGTVAWRSILAAHTRGALLAGASAGAMGLAGRTWTPFGFRPGLDLVRGLIVVPHFARVDLRDWQATIAALDAAGLGRLGLDERTGVISSNGTWRVVGEGRAHWFPVHGEPIVARDGGTLPLPA